MKKTYFINNLVKYVMKGGDINGPHVKLPYKNFMLVIPPYMVLMTSLILCGLIYFNYFRKSYIQNIFQNTNTEEKELDDIKNINEEEKELDEIKNINEDEKELEEQLDTEDEEI